MVYDHKRNAFVVVKSWLLAYTGASKPHFAPCVKLILPCNTAWDGRGDDCKDLVQNVLWILPWYGVETLPSVNSRATSEALTKLQIEQRVL